MSNPFTMTPASGSATLHGYTFAALKKAVERTLPEKSRLRTEAGEIVNDAITYLVMVHPWTWRNAAMSLNFTADQNYVLLPTDFGRLLTLQRASSTARAVGKSLGEITLLRQAGGTLPNSGIYYAVNWSGQQSVTSHPRARLEIYPTPTSAVTGALVGTYERVVGKLTNPTDVPDLPPQFHVLLKRLCRAFAASDEMEKVGSDWQIFEQMLPNYVEEDGDGQDNLGRIRGATEEVPTDGPFAWRRVNPAP